MPRFRFTPILFFCALTLTICWTASGQDYQLIGQASGVRATATVTPTSLRVSSGTGVTEYFRDSSRDIQGFQMYVNDALEPPVIGFPTSGSGPMLKGTDNFGGMSWSQSDMVVQPLSPRPQVPQNPNNNVGGGSNIPVTPGGSNIPINNGSSSIPVNNGGGSSLPVNSGSPPSNSGGLPINSGSGPSGGGVEFFTVESNGANGQVEKTADELRIDLNGRVIYYRDRSLDAVGFQGFKTADGAYLVRWPLSGTGRPQSGNLDRNGSVSWLESPVQIVSGQPGAGAGVRRVHVVIAAQSGTPVAPFNSMVEMSLTKMQDLMTKIGPEFKGSETVLSAGQCSADNIVSVLQNLNPAPQDTIFFYYSGHGANELGRHYFALRESGGRDLPRDEVAAILRQKNVRLAVMISESCNNHLPMVGRTLAASPGSTRTLTQIEDLLLSYRGFLDVNSTSPGQAGWGDSEIGGYFSTAFSYRLSALAPEGDWASEIQTIANEANEIGSLRSSEAQPAAPLFYGMNIEPDPYYVDPGERFFQGAIRN
ncbi:MAG: caspase family protein [Planctomycetota bacterium]